MYQPSIPRSKILTPAEIGRVVFDLRQRQMRDRQGKVRLVVFRLACGCGLRRKEIAGLNMDDLVLEGPSPELHVRAETSKADRKGVRHGRTVPLWLDDEVLKDIKDWVRARRAYGGEDGDPLVVGWRGKTPDKRLRGADVAERWNTAVKVLGPERARQLSVHCGRHTFATYVVRVYGLACARDWLGHSNVSTTNQYLHVAKQLRKKGNLFTEEGDT